MPKEEEFQIRGFILTPISLLMATVLWDTNSPGISILLVVVGLVIFLLTLFDIKFNETLPYAKKTKLLLSLTFATLSLSWLFVDTAFDNDVNDASLEMPEDAKPIYAKVSRACPGFAEFKNAITFDRIELNDAVWYDGDSRSGLTAIYLKITGNLDADPIAQGNTCRYVLTKSEDRVISQKEACATLCEGREIASLNGENYEALVP